MAFPLSPFEGKGDVTPHWLVLFSLKRMNPKFPSSSGVREAAAECVVEIVSKKMPPVAKLDLVMDFLRVLPPGEGRKEAG